MDVSAFVHELRWEDLPENVRSQARRFLLDIRGAAIGGRGTELSRIIHDYAAAARSCGWTGERSPRRARRWPMG